jgi:hypothetical protein
MINWTENGLDSLSIADLQVLSWQAEADGDNLTCMMATEEITKRLEAI